MKRSLSAYGWAGGEVVVFLLGYAQAQHTCSLRAPSASFNHSSLCISFYGNAM